jgi:hypothetical protein
VPFLLILVPALATLVPFLAIQVPFLPTLVPALTLLVTALAILVPALAIQYLIHQILFQERIYLVKQDYRILTLVSYLATLVSALAIVYWIIPECIIIYNLVKQDYLIQYRDQIQSRILHCLWKTQHLKWIISGAIILDQQQVNYFWGVD